jgi:phosphatidylinositol 4-kinase
MVALPFEVFTPSAISAGIEVWTWVISEKSEVEVALMGEILTAWSETITHEKGIFSTALKCAMPLPVNIRHSSAISYDDPFYHPISYSPTDKDVIDRAIANARRLLTPHTRILHMLQSRLQTARYKRSGVMFLIQRFVLRSARAHKSQRFVSFAFVPPSFELLSSTHALARDARFSFLLFGFETLKSSHLDSYCEHVLRENLYSAAYSWFAARPQ